MRNFKQWFTERFPKENLPSSMSGKWFAEHGLPMIVSCTCCQTTMTLPSALIGGDNDIFCHDCAGDDEEESGDVGCSTQYQDEEDEEGEDNYTLDDLGPNWY